MKLLAIVLVSALTLLAQSQAPSSTNIAGLKVQAESGNSDAQVRLGNAFAAGEGVATDDAEAVKWFRKAAEAGNAQGEYALGEMYFTGRGVAVDFSEAVKWIQRSAEHGDARGQYNLAAIYLQGMGVSKNIQLAAKWMRKAADQGFAAGEFGLGSMYENGNGVSQSSTEALKWYRKSAAQGDSTAMNNLAMMLVTSSDPRIRNPREAVSLAEKAVGVEPQNAAYLDTLATTYFAFGQLEKAFNAEEHALELRPDSQTYKEALEKYKAAVQATR